MKKVVWLMREYENGEHSAAVIYWYGILESLGYKVVYYPYETYNADAFFFEMREYKPDFIFHPCYETLHTELVRLREFTKVYVIQSDDDWRFSSYAKHYIPFVDGTISYQANPQWYIDSGATPNQVIAAKWAFNPNTMMLEASAEHKDILLSHGGGLHADRSELIQTFVAKGLSVAIASNVRYGQLLDLWDRSKYSLCFTKSSQGGFRQKKGRVAEIAYHSILVSEPFPQMEDYYEPDKEFLVFESVDEAVEKIRFYERSPLEAEKIFLAGKKRLWNTNTVFHQWNHIMSLIDRDYKQINVQNLLKKYE